MTSGMTRWVRVRIERVAIHHERPDFVALGACRLAPTGAESLSRNLKIDSRARKDVVVPIQTYRQDG